MNTLTNFLDELLEEPNSEINLQQAEEWSDFDFVDRFFGSNRDGLLTQRVMEEGECKLFKEEKKYGACTFVDVHPDIKTFMEPYIPKGL